jgi:hypothetical protein
VNPSEVWTIFISVVDYWIFDFRQIEPNSHIIPLRHSYISSNKESMLWVHPKYRKILFIASLKVPATAQKWFITICDSGLYSDLFYDGGKSSRLPRMELYYCTDNNQRICYTICGNLQDKYPILQYKFTIFL